MSDLELLREMNAKLAKLDKFIEDAIGGRPHQVILGRNTVTTITVDIVDLMEIAGNEWSDLARQHKEKLCALVRKVS